MLKFFGIFCLLLITQVLSEGDEENPTSTSPMKDKKQGKMMRSLSVGANSVKNTATSVKNTVTGFGTSIISSTIEPVIESNLKQIPDQLRSQFITVLKALLETAIPGGGAIAPLLDNLAKKESSSRATTDYIILCKLIDDEEQLKKFMELGSDSDVVTQVVDSFMVSLREKVDVFVQNYLPKMKDSSELILEELGIKYS